MQASIELSDSPPRKRHYLPPRSGIPQNIRSNLLPLRTASISSLLGFDRFPPITPPDPIHERSTGDSNALITWFSHDSPGELESDAVLCLPHPPEPLVRALFAFLENSRPVASSIIPLHLPVAQHGLRLPFWVLEYWLEAHWARNCKKQWQESMDWLETHREAVDVLGKETQTQLKQVIDRLIWSDDVRGPQFCGSGVENICAYLSDAWLSGGHIADQIAALQHDLSSASRSISGSSSCRHLLVGLEFSEQLIRAYGDQSDYLSRAKRYSLLHDIQLQLGSGLLDSVGGLAHVNGNHYIAFVLDMKQGVLRSGDSLRRPLCPKLRVAFLWWFTLVRSSGNVPHPQPTIIKEGQLPITPQNDDHSCAVLALNALAHHYIPQEALIPPANPAAIAHERMRLALRVLKVHSYYMSLKNSVLPTPVARIQAEISRAHEPPKCEFTFTCLSADLTRPHPHRRPGAAALRPVVSWSPIQDDSPSESSDADLEPSGRLEDFTTAARTSEDLDDGILIPPLSHSSPPSSVASHVLSSAGGSRPLSTSQAGDLDDDEVADATSIQSASSRDTGSLYTGTDSQSSACSSHSDSADRASIVSSALGTMDDGESEINVDESTALAASPVTSRGRHDRTTTHAPQLRQSTLDRFVQKISHEELRERSRRESQRTAAKREALQEKIRQWEDQKMLAKRQAAKDRQRKCRKRRYERERDAGKRDENLRIIKPRPQKLQRLREHDDISHSDSPAFSLPESTRPHRQFEEAKRSAANTSHKPGRRRKSTYIRTKTVNWKAPHLWKMIDETAREVGYPWSPKEIVRRLRQKSETLFGRLREQRLSDWRDRTVTDRLVWKPEVLKAVEKGYRQGGHATRKGILDDYPDVVKEIVAELQRLRDTSVALDTTTIRAVMVAIITHRAPEVFSTVRPDGQHFECPEVYVRRFLKRHLDWSLRRATRPGHKFPQNVEDVCLKFFLRNAIVVRDENVEDGCFIVNSDQTQVLYSSGHKLTYTPCGSKQVAVVGTDEKRAFTLMVGISASGEVLPFQAIYQGTDSSRSLPSRTARGMAEAQELGFLFELSRTRTYWATLETMKSYVMKILVPYFEKKKRQFPHRKKIKCIWNIDVWSIHRSEEFRTWMKTSYAWIIVIYIPGGCTPLLQACDVGIQRVLKLAIKRSAHADVVEDTLTQLRVGKAPSEVLVSKKVGVLRDRSVQWLVNGYNAINHPELAFQLCEAGQFNMSYECLSSAAAREALSELREADPVFYAEITSGQDHASICATGPDGTFVEDADPNTAGFELGDDSATRLKTVVESLSLRNRSDEPAVYSDSDEDALVPGDVADSDADAFGAAVQSAAQAVKSIEAGPAPSRASKRVRFPNKLYNNAEWYSPDTGLVVIAGDHLLVEELAPSSSTPSSASPAGRADSSYTPRQQAIVDGLIWSQLERNQRQQEFYRMRREARRLAREDGPEASEAASSTGRRARHGQGTSNGSIKKKRRVVIPPADPEPSASLQGRPRDDDDDDMDGMVLEVPEDNAAVAAAAAKAAKSVGADSVENGASPDGQSKVAAEKDKAD
ncbi:hypothetical protein ACG7TL_008372 [Trametes sanguinea]